jgi:hypothetical protein
MPSSHGGGEFCFSHLCHGLFFSLHAFAVSGARRAREHNAGVGSAPRRALLCSLGAGYCDPKTTMSTWASMHGNTASPVYKAVSRPGPANEKGNLSASLKNPAVKGLVTITCMPGGKPEVVDLTREGQNRAAALTASCE